MNYYKRHVGDYLRDTAHLSLLEHGVYCRLLDVYYTRETGIPDGQAARLISARTKEEIASVNAVLSEFFVLEYGIWRQKRADAEIAEAQDKAERNREIGKKGGRPRNSGNPEITQTVSINNPDGFQNETQNEPTEQKPTGNPSHKPLANNQEKKKPQAAPSLSVDDLIGDGLDVSSATEFLSHRQRKGARLTALAWAGFKKEVAKAGWTLPAAVEKSIARGWVSFEAAWVSGDPKPAAPRPPEKTKSLAEVGL